MKYKLRKISGDASFREFYRLKKGNKKLWLKLLNIEEVNWKVLKT